MTRITIDCTVESEEVVAISFSTPGGTVADIFDVAFGHRCLYDHAKRLNERREWPCPICGAELEVSKERYSCWVHFFCHQCRISGNSCGNEESLRAGYEIWASHIRSMIEMGREASE